MTKTFWNNLKSYFTLAAWVFIAVMVMRAAEHFGASQIEAGCATIAAVIAYFWSLGVDALREMAPELDLLLVKWKERLDDPQA